MKTLMTVVRRSSHYGCNKAGSEHIEDDVAQEVFMLFLEKLIDKFDEDYNAEPILIEVSRRVAMAMSRKSREVCLEDMEELHESAYAVINTHNGLESNPVSVFDQRKALQTIKMKFPAVIEGERNLQKADAGAFMKKRQRVERTLSESCAKLREIRTSLGKTQEEFSSLLGIPNATLLSYEYGRSPNVPEDLMDRAKELFKEEHSVARRNRDQAQKHMKDYVAEWAEYLAVDPNDFKTIAEIIGVSKSTIHRWVEGDMRPHPRALSGYIRTVKLVGKRIKAGSKAAAEIY